MSDALRRRMAGKRAENILRDGGHHTLPVDPFAIAEDAGIVIQPKPGAEDGVSGMLLRHGDTFGILYATHLGNESFERFSIGHELGHYFLDGHIDHVLPPGSATHASHAGFASTDQYEREADHFSAGLLMPGTPCRRLLDQFEPGLGAIEALAARCRTSLTAAAIRYAELTDDAVGVILSTDNTVDFCFLSDTMKAQPQITWLRRAFPIPHHTATHAFNLRPALVRTSARTEADCDILDWLGGNRSLGAKEEVRGLGRYRKTLTVLSVPSRLDETFQDEDEDEDEDLEERWTPRFRR